VAAYIPNMHGMTRHITGAWHVIRNRCIWHDKG